jgi:S1-C subfamily serine protease
LSQVARSAQLPDFTDLVEKQSPAVVNITTTQDARSVEECPPAGVGRNVRFLPPHDAAEGQGMLPPRRGQGSGFMISSDGYILTNTHVIDEVDEVVVKLNDKREFRAKVIGTDKRTDVALIKINASNLPAVRIGDPNRLRSANGCWRSARRSASKTPPPPASSPPRGAACRRRTMCPSSRPTSRSIPAIPADRCSTCAAKWSA